MKKRLAKLCLIILWSSMTIISTFAAQVDNHDSEKPSVVRAVVPAFPLPVNGPNAFGSVVVEVQINATGVVTVAHAVQGHPALYKAAESAARRWLFAPIKDQSKVRMVRLTFLFKFMAEDTPEEDLLPIFMPPYQIEVRRILPVIKTKITNNASRNLTTHSTGARVSLPFIVNLDGFGVACAPG